MSKSVVGLFDNFSDAQSVVSELESAGFDRDSISIVANQNAAGYSGSGETSGGVSVSHALGDAVKGGVKGGVIGGLTGLAASLAMLAIPGIGPVLAVGPLAATLGGASLGATAGGVIGGLTGLGVPDEDAHLYSEGVRRGGTLVSVNAPDDMADQALAIFNRYNPVDIDSRGGYYKESGYTGYTETAAPYTPELIESDRTAYSTYATSAAPLAPVATTTTTAAPLTGTTVEAGQTVAVPIIEESLAVGKRAVEGGGARIHTRVIETPVSESVTLREEHATVDRNVVDRAVTSADIDAFKEGVIEVTEYAEQAVVGKEARVVGEVVIGKEASERTETVSDTVRRTEVEVEQLNTTTTEVTPTTTTSTTSTTKTSGSNY